MSRGSWLVPAVVLLAACRSDSVVTTVDPSVAVVNPQMWSGDSLRLVSTGFSAQLPVVVAVDDTVVPGTHIAGAGTDTLAVHEYWRTGWHTVAVRIGDRRPPAMRFEVHGFEGYAAGFPGTVVPVHLIGRPLAAGEGSSKFWVGTDRGLALLDALSPTTPPVLVDSTVDVSCLSSIMPAPGGAVVTVDRGCGTLRARRYGTATVEVDSGPRAAGWLHAINGRPGVWLLVGRDSVGLAVRQGDGSWQWSYYHWSTQAMFADRGKSEDYPPEVSPDGRLAVAGRLRKDWRRADLLVFDLQTGALLFRQDSAPGPSVGFSPSGDTMVAVEDSALVLLDSRTGTRLAAYVDRAYGFWGQEWGPFVWDRYGPWLYAWYPNGCPALLVVDRRTWTRSGSFGWEADIPECDGAIAVSGFTRTGWALELSYLDVYPYIVVPFTIPDP